MAHKLSDNEYYAKILAMFNARLDKSGGDSACWTWTRGRNKRGYGNQAWRRQKVLAHRLAWTFAHGTIPGGLWVLHHCDNPPCCNPAHLFLGTNSDNKKDASAKGLIFGQHLTHCKHGHELTPRNTYVRAGGNSRQCRRCNSAAQARRQVRIRERAS